MDEEVEEEQKMERLKRKKRIENEKSDISSEERMMDRKGKFVMRREKSGVSVNGINGNRNIFSTEQEKYVIVSLFWHLKNASAQQKNG